MGTSSQDTSRAMMHRSLGLATLLLPFATPSGAQAAVSNTLSPMGTNLAPVNYWSSEQPFLNIFKTAGGWITHSNSAWDTNEEQYLNLDSNGYPVTLTAMNDPAPQQFISVGVLLLRSLPNTANGYYPAGKYVVLYDGQGTLTYGFNASLVSSSPGRDVINVANPSSAGIDLRIVATDPNHSGNYLRNIRAVKAENETALNAGQVFNPTFLNLIKNFRALRFMDWFSTNGSTLSSWANRPVPANAFWGTGAGVPIEVAVQLANAISADAWVNVPVMADDNYITQMAKFVYSQLGNSQKAYVELSNEVWNSSFSQNAYSITQGQALYSKAPNKWYAGWEWYGMRVAQVADIWYSVYGSNFNSRVTVVMSGQGANAAVLTEELSTPDWTGAGNGPAVSHHIGVAAIAMYFGGLPSASCLATWTSQSDGGLASLFQSLYSQNDPSVPPNGYLAQAYGYMSSNASAIAHYKIPLVGYEGGQSFEGFPSYLNGSSVVSLLIAANRDARMGTAYASYLNGWKANGGTLFMHYYDVGATSQYGEWGALESIMQTTSPLSSAPPKWQAIEDFISGNVCWWPGCARSHAATPAPTNLKAQ
jgi:hypothetical protein